MNKLVIGILILFVLGLIMRSMSSSTKQSEAVERVFTIQAIDTVKHSRDRARAHLFDESYQEFIDAQIARIAATGATHVAIGTPYDVEFVPFLKRWVTSARAHGLQVWFRGNLSGWEEWFEYEPITREAHMRGIEAFILANQSLFEDGDIFTACPECENGGPGDPRETGDVDGHRNFLIEEYSMTQRVFKSIGKDVISNLTGMNYDVASLIMDPATTHALGGVVTVDHYVLTPAETVEDLRVLSQKSGGVIVLGEVGAPIPDIHGDMTEQEQQVWINDLMSRLFKAREVIGINYWTSAGASTELWHDDGSPKKAVQAITHYFSPPVVSGTVVDPSGKRLSDVLVTLGDFSTITSGDGTFALPNIDSSGVVAVSKSEYIPITVHPDIAKTEVIVLRKEHETLIDGLLHFYYRLMRISGLER